MKSAAKRRNFFSAFIALALLFCASHVASANVLEISKTRAELKTDLGQNRVSESLFYSVKRGENYDSLSVIALESSVAPGGTGGQLSVPQKVFTSTDVPADIGRPRGTFVTETDITQPQNLVPHVQRNVPPNPARPPGSLPHYVTEIDVPQGSVLPDPTVPFKPNDPTGYLPPQTPGARVNQVYEVIEDAMGNVTIRPVGGGS